MNVMPDLQTALLDLLNEASVNDLKLIIGGGYGIFLKRDHVARAGVQTLITELPESRSTNDIDFFLRPELLINSQQLEPLAAALKRLGYQVVKGAEKYQFAKSGPSGGRDGALKIDLLTGPRNRFVGTGVKADSRRARPNPSIDLHAHPVDEALTLEENLLPIELNGKTSEGVESSGVVYLPHPLSFAMMKLFAFRDRVDDEDKGFGSYHALDLYTVIASMSESEWEQALALCVRHSSDPIFKEAVMIVNQYFDTISSIGVIRIKESPYFRKELNLSAFMKALRDLFQMDPADGAA